MQVSYSLPVYISTELMMSCACCRGQEVEEVHYAEKERCHRAGSEDGPDKEALWEEMPAGCTHQMVKLDKNTEEDTGW